MRACAKSRNEKCYEHQKTKRKCNVCQSKFYRSAREWGRIVPAKGRPKRGIRDAVVGAQVNVFNRQTFTFDNCTCTIVRHSVGAVFPDLRYKL